MSKEVCFNICRECIKHQPSCCRGNSVPLTVADVERISALGHDPMSFVLAGEYGREFVEGFEAWWVESFVSRGAYLYKLNTRTREDGHCVFLIDGKGCTLGEDRPFICRMYPFWVDDAGAVVYEPEELDSCFIAKKRYSVEEGMQLVGESRAAVHKYFTALKNDCTVEREAHERLVDSILATATNAGSAAP
jgi:Fe-S-cluster containining protein